MQVLPRYSLKPALTRSNPPGFRPTAARTTTSQGGAGASVFDFLPGGGPVKYADPDGRDIEVAKQAGRSIAIASSLLEVSIGLALLLIPEPTATTKIVGATMLIHGGSNLIQGIVSLSEYNKSNGEIELPTSFIGMVTYIANYGYPDRDGKAAIGDLIDGILAPGISPTTQAPQILSTLASVSILLSITGDAELAYLTLVDKGYVGSYEGFIKSFQPQLYNNE
jgi:hypothetical protein